MCPQLYNAVLYKVSKVMSKTFHGFTVKRVRMRMIRLNKNLVGFSYFFFSAQTPSMFMLLEKFSIVRIQINNSGRQK